LFLFCLYVYLHIHSCTHACANKQNKHINNTSLFNVLFFFLLFVFQSCSTYKTRIYLEDSPTVKIDSMHKCNLCVVFFKFASKYIQNFLFCCVNMQIWWKHIQSIACLFFFLTKEKQKHLLEGVSYAVTLRYTTSNCATISFCKKKRNKWKFVFFEMQ